MDKPLPRLPERPAREPGENDCGFALRLLAWYDRAVCKGYDLAELPKLSEEERSALLASWQPVLCMAMNLGLLPVGTKRQARPGTPSAGSVGPAGQDEPASEPGPAASPADTVSPRRGSKRRGRKERAP